jgi:hypothetical protein
LKRVVARSDVTMKNITFSGDKEKMLIFQKPKGR